MHSVRRPGVTGPGVQDPAVQGPRAPGRRPVQFWLYLPQLRMEFATLVQRARAAELAGFTGVALMDHLTPPGLPSAAVYDSMTTAAVLASSTTYLKLAHLVLSAPYHHPATLAKQTVSLDHLSAGRFELGLGWGSAPTELARFGFADRAPDRAARLEELLQVLARLLAGETFDHAGRFFRLDGASQRPTPLHGPIPVTVGGCGALTVPIVRRFADWWNIPSYGAPRVDELVPQAGGVAVSLQLPVGLARGRADAAAVTELAQRRFGHWGGLVTGTPDEVTAALLGYRDRGIDRFYLQFSDFGRPETLRAFSREVMPALLAGPT